MIYYLGEFWHLLGFDFVTAMNLACAFVVLGSAGTMFQPPEYTERLVHTPSSPGEHTVPGVIRQD
jgi:hypothetical protein